MATPQHQQPLLHHTEVSCDVSGEGGASVRISGARPHRQPSVASKRCKYSISSVSSSGESGVRRPAAKGLRGNRKMPQLFERSAGHFWDPKFDSGILEEACRERCFPQTRRCFRCMLFYLAFASLLWGAYFAANPARCDRLTFLLPAACFLLLCLLLFLFTFTRPYARRQSLASLLLIAATFALTLALQVETSGFRDSAPGPWVREAVQNGSASLAPCLSPVGSFSLCVEVLLLLYSVLHLRLYTCALLGLLYSALFEVLGLVNLGPGSWSPWPYETLVWLAPAKALLHLCAHAMGIHLFVVWEVRSRSTFLKVGQAIMHGKDLEVEKALKERMIHSVMPRRIADELMRQGDEDGADNSGKRYSTGAALAGVSSPKGGKRKKTSIPRGQIVFRPFNMKRMEPVSILFADIVGFTKMSANKSAHALVGLLNDLFGRFDRLCELTCCEKISTLGDCYYCVAGCPEPRPDHAYCCVEMGLGMIQAIEQFCQEKREMVNMRVGVHTGTVLCGILGMRRFKFDVWSNDVNLANLMEQLGVAGKVHLSEATARFLDDRYQRGDGNVTERIGQGVVAEQLKGLKTYLISGRRLEHPQCLCSSQTGSGAADSVGPQQRTHTPDSSPHNHTMSKSPSPSCTVLPVEDPSVEGAVQNGCSEDLKGGSKLPMSQNPRAVNGLLSPQMEEALSSSQTSLCEMLHENKWAGGMDHSALIPLRSKNFRERSDAHFVDVIKEDSLMKDYFFKPPIHKISHTFLDKSLESAYRKSYQEEYVLNDPSSLQVESQAVVQTFASPSFSWCVDMLLCCCVFVALSLACFLRPLLTHQPLPTPAIALGVGAFLLLVAALALSVRMALYLDRVMACTRMLLWVMSGWVPRHLIGAVLVSLPALSIFSHITCNMHLSIQFTMFICCAVIIAITQYCNFCQLSFWMRSALAAAVGLVLLTMLYSSPCRFGGFGNSSVSIGPLFPETGVSKLERLLGLEATLALFLLLLLVFFLNREFEISCRLHYHGNVEADQHRIKIQNMRDQADWLLRNIIPIHVAEQLKVTQSYSKNHDNAGVIFGSIVNFSEFYEESYEGGKECYRVLNELIGDFDELLRMPAFANIEKIKTIGATYMAASGLNAQQHGDPTQPHAHLRALFDFAQEMMRVVDDFNKNMLGFKFKLRIGFNHGPLTAGVIGTTKLLYDIWGDTVNIASRMDTTGVECRIQVSEESFCILSAMSYAFDYRGTVNVKGKGQMKTFLFPQSADRTAVPLYQLSVSPEIRTQVDGSIGRSPTDEISNMVPVVAGSRISASMSACSGLGAGPDFSRGGVSQREGHRRQASAHRSASSTALCSTPLSTHGHLKRGSHDAHATHTAHTAQDAEGTLSARDDKHTAPSTNAAHGTLCPVPMSVSGPAHPQCEIGAGHCVGELMKP
ncbi:adenylate cyclase type 9 isoform X2 [Denticeps clupeoides]|uniref:adenylate cyclase type 9 isoform X2 n=1 Tax=Denticeps clupeoides TaxID=299321 RepID=UPI0010A2F6D5|nr:adenylate cyclase type 9 isoform X2 [Denticeps clupeoides]